MLDDPSRPAGQVATASGSGSSERREVPRYPFIASAEETDLESGTRLTARVAELSRKGCYLDTLNPFPNGTRIRLIIFHSDATFTTLAKVIYAQPNMGMGVAFTTIEPAQMDVLQKWLAEIGAG